ncbi:hypothetical protein [Daejeonella sp.]|uniref:hypothetical protein n=1 Tax=Daejeonella sp. TaxID=2805397 RepID=UPI0025B9F45F|nr:hypothetical protein [Daejeonella sp.]
MEEVQGQNIDIKLFADYVADPSASSFAEAAAISATIDIYPYCQLLYLFNSRASTGKEIDSKNNYLAKASLIIPDRSVLFTVLNHPEKLIAESPKVLPVIENSEELNKISIELEESTFTEINFYEVEELIIPEDKQSDNEVVLEPIEGQSSATNTEVETSISNPSIESQETEQKVSKYDDDKMPFSFLWWLNKTRKEHSDTYQPYVDFKLDTSQSIKRSSVDQLSSQIIENIFHLQSPLEELENTPKTVPFQVRRKEDSILEKFIKEEPQIKAPNSQKLDTENKARKSSEDPNDLVSETLAQIYIDQMLFQKAIDTYKKLSLKYPEKRTYFADQIIELEKKVN